MKQTININGVEYDLVPTKVTQPNKSEAAAPHPGECSSAASDTTQPAPDDRKNITGKITMTFVDGDPDVGVQIENISVHDLLHARDAIEQAIQDGIKEQMLQNFSPLTQIFPELFTAKPN